MPWPAWPMSDDAIRLTDGRYLMAPMILARLLETARIGGADVVLDLGCGSGYSAAVLAAVASTVVAVECDSELAAQAGRLMTELGIDNTAIVEAPLTDGYPKQAPYDVILLGGSVPEPPPVPD